jgi:acyl transferase domain-containing protein/NADPH:quinone reductase-like Zn-dependent oxidoreductase/acyl carrier protein
MSHQHTNGHTPDMAHRLEPIALIGIGCRFPGKANDPASFWQLLIDGVDAVREVPDERWNKKVFYDPEMGKPGKSHACWGGFLENIDQFDAAFFGISPREAAHMDPQQRLLLETSWEALEDAGQSLERLAGSKTSVFVGISSWEYSFAQIEFRDRARIDAYTNTGGALSIAANRISYSFDLKGPSVAVDTACSSALTAVHLACKSIWEEHCPLALAGGVNALLLPDWYVGFSRLGMLSPDGRCHAFDAAANGFVRGEGAGFVVLKPLSRALADGDRIYALIRGSAVNQDGRTPGLTVPNEEAQVALLRQVYRRAGVDPAGVGYIEAHGTGTPVGDPIEARALGRVLSAGRVENRPCLVGSVKTNIGHLEAGSGIAGLIKTALALHHRRIPGNLHFHRPNPAIDFARLRLRVPANPEPWRATDGPLTAGVNSFGYGGANAHVVLQEAPLGRVSRGSANLRASQQDAAELVPLSARGSQALGELASVWRQFVADCPADVSLHDLAYNAAHRRTHHDHRLALVVHSREELMEALAAASSQTIGARPRLAFVCSGQGPQWWAMGRQLLECEPVFRAVIERCDAIVCRLGSWSLLHELTADEAGSKMHITAISQPAIFAVQIALAALWDSWGVRPDAMMGHSVGEVAAAYLAGVFSLEDAVRVIYQRGRCMELAPTRGRMLAAGVTADEARRLIAPFSPRVELAAVNAPASVTLSGEENTLKEIAKILESRGAFQKFLHVHYAFHSAQMNPVKEELMASLRGIAPGKSTLPLFSTVAGRRIEGPEMGPEYWWRNVRQTVRFADAVDRMLDEHCDTFVELSPHPVLLGSLLECSQARGRTVQTLPSLRRREDERATILKSLGKLYTLGYPIDWNGVIPGPAQTLTLPLYPWQREHYWSESEESRSSRLSPPAHPLLGTSLREPRPAWETRLDVRLLPYLNDHRVQGAAIFPATAYLEMAFAVGRAVFGEIGCQLEDVKLLNPCFLDADQARRLRAMYDVEDAAVRIHSRIIDGDEEWTPHALLILRKGEQNAPASPVSLDAIRARYTTPISSDDSYAFYRKIGFEYGPAFRGIVGGWHGNGEALGEIRLPDTASETDYVFHPALLDACFQCVLAAVDWTDEGQHLYLPVEIERIRLHRSPGRHLWSHARVRERTKRTLIADVDIYDENSILVAKIRGLRAQPLSHGDKGETLDELLYAYEWRAQPLAKKAAALPGRWLIFADRGGVGAQMADRLRDAGGDCILVFAGDGFSKINDNGYRIDPRNREEMERLLRECVSLSSCGGIVHLWNLDAPATEQLSLADLEAMQDPGLLSVVHLVQAWDKIGGAAEVRLCLVTRGAQCVGDEAKPAAVAQSPVIGLGRVIANEYSRLRCKMVDLDPDDEDAGLADLFDELRFVDDEDEIALRRGERLGHRFVPSGAESAVPAAKGEPFRLTIAQPGNLDALTARVQRRHPPEAGQVEIEVAAAGLNFSDVLKALGIYPGIEEGVIPLGAECAGRIVAVGDNVHAFQVGDEVLAVAPFAFGSHVLTRAELVAPKPPHWSFEEAASFPIAFLTASYALEHLGRLCAGERVLIHSATGGVGLAAIQLARRAGAEIFATAGTDEKRAYLRELGIEHVMDSRSLAFADEIMERTNGRGVDAVLNSLAGEALSRGVEILADYGRFLEIGKRDVYGNTRLGLRPFRKNLSFHAIDLDRLIRERPALLGDLLRRLVQDARAGTLAPLPQSVYPIGEATSAFRFMQQSKHIGKIALSMQPSEKSPLNLAPSEDPLALHADATYLITGGLGGFGLAVARWMVERGARHLALVGRRGIASEHARQAVAEMEQRGAQIVVYGADAASASDLAAVLADIERSGFSLRGVVHAAMVLEDALLLNLDRERLRRVLAPKIQGTWNLHQQTLAYPLDFFVLFSSLSSVFGHAGQANYAAANLFLDTLAWHRRAQGLPALTVNWGYLGDAGYLAERPQLGERLERQGIRSFSTREALTLLERALQRKMTQVGVLRVDWTRWRGLGATGRVSPRFAHLLRTSDLDASKQALPLEAKIRDKVARVLGTTPERLDVDKPLLNLGIDSLMAVELRNWIEQELRINLPIMELMRSPSLSCLLDRVREHSANGVAHEPSNPQENSVDAEGLLARIEELPAAEVDTLLATLLAGESTDRSNTR